MKDLLLCKPGEIFLKGLNKHYFEERLVANVKRRLKPIGHFRVTYLQSALYIEAADDTAALDAAYDAVRKVFGSTGNQIRLRLIRTFMLYVGIAFIIAVPIVVHFMSKWIEQYSYRIVWWPWIVAAGAIVMLISLAAVAVQSWMASNENPVKNIRQE